MSSRLKLHQPRCCVGGAAIVLDWRLCRQQTVQDASQFHENSLKTCCEANVRMIVRRVLSTKSLHTVTTDSDRPLSFRDPKQHSDVRGSLAVVFHSPV